MKKICYLAGPIDRCPDLGITWRKKISKFLNKINIKVNDPLLKLTELGREDLESRDKRKTYKEKKDYKSLSKIMKEIRKEDLNLVKKSDIIIANIDLNIYSCGTLEEIFLAKKLNKKIFIHVKQGKINTPDWLFGVVDHKFIFSNWLELQKFIEKNETRKSFDKIKTENRISNTGEKNAKNRTSSKSMLHKHG
jgi:nucleoside 2-deoxyribosyltransferase